MSSLSYLNLIEKLKIKAFTALPPNANEDINAIKKSLNYYRCDHELIDFSKIKFNHVLNLDKLLNAVDEPVFNSSHLYQFYLRQMINKENYHVILTGDGADEIFGGYKKVYFSYLASLFHCVSKRVYQYP